MNILSDNPSKLKAALNDEVSVLYSPALDVYTEDSMFLRTLKGMFCSSKLDLENEGVLAYIKEIAKPADLPEPVCHTCYNYADFDSFCKEYIDKYDDKVHVAYDVETTAAPFLSPKYKLAGFSLATEVSNGCYVILDSIDYHNPDTDAIFGRLADVLRKHNMLVFNLQHEYIATNICVDVDMSKECAHVDDAYSMALLFKTESFKADVFKLKLLCNRLLGLDNWATIIDDYIDLATQIARCDRFNYNELTEDEKELIVSYRDMLKSYGYSGKEVLDFIAEIQDSYTEWEDQDILPYSLIPSKMIAKYGCYDSCYLLALFDYFETWKKELTVKLDDCLNKPNIDLAYEEVMNGQIMSAILTLNGMFVDEDRDKEVKEKSKKLASEHYNKLWEIKSDVTGNIILKDFAKEKYKNILRKNYLLPECLLNLIPDGWKFIKTTPTFYSFECEATSLDALNWAKDIEKLKPCNKEGTHFKLLQKHLKPFSTLSNEDELLDVAVEKYLQDAIKKDGSLAESVFTPMSGPSELYDLLNADLKYSHFRSRVILYEYSNLPENKKKSNITKFLDEHLLYDFDTNPKLYMKVASVVKDTVIDYISKQYSYKNLYEKLIKEGIKSFASDIIAYIYTIYTATGCSVENPKHSAFDFICQLKVCRKYLRIVSTFIKGASGGYTSQMRVYKNSINNKFLTLADTKVVDDSDNPVVDDNTSRVVFGKWYASTADTGRWQATVHNIPAGAYCKRRFTSRYPGGVILANDMSQAEVRELAMVSNCVGLIETIKDPTVDMHRRTAQLAFNVPYDEVTSAQRKQAKEGVFSVVYGREESSLAQSLFKGDKTAAKRLMDSIFKAYPEIPRYLENILADVREHGYLVTRRGEPIFVNPYTSMEKSKGEQAWIRNTRNYGIQGGASFWCTGTLVNIQKLIDKHKLKSKIICYIHDSIEIDCHPDEIDTVIRIMSYAFNELATKQFKVPTASDTVIGVSMGEELELERIEANHYKIEGNNNDILDLIKQLELTYDVEIVSSNVGERSDQSDNVDWVFTPRAQLQWYNEITPAKYEIVLHTK